ncbi:hypothetical protein [uncultured Sulfitobacter sp.]|uniref:hypothetical protein n=1 Tax=uncultured Sulfitobacter sp. TaxID=191468 RepID=UPI0026300DEE|nr:hypothetical protein [uncultured Sulfitobacter sp.]
MVYVQKTIGSFEEAPAIIRLPIADITNRLPSEMLIDPIILFEDLVEQDLDSPAEIELLEVINIAKKGEASTVNELRHIAVKDEALDRTIGDLCASFPSMSTAFGCGSSHKLAR